MRSCHIGPANRQAERRSYTETSREPPNRLSPIVHFPGKRMPKNIERSQNIKMKHYTALTERMQKQMEAL